MARIEVRAARLHEAEAVGTMTEKVYRDGDYTDDEYAVHLRDAATRIREALVLVALLDGELAGALALAEHARPFGEIARPGELEVRMLAVADHARRQGVAASLMAATEAHATGRGLQAVVLSTEPHMHAAHRMYEGRGYVRQPDRDWDVGIYRLLVYRRALDP